MTTRKRDTQRKRVYTAEAAWRTEARTRGWLVPFPTRWEAQTFVEAVHRWCVAKRGRVPHIRAETPTVRVRKGAAKGVVRRSFAYGEKWMIRLGELDNETTLHELAHLYAPPGERHGPGFAATYLVLVAQFIGDDAAEHLKECMTRARVRLRPKRRVTVSAARRAQLVAQLARVRKEASAGPT